MKPKLLQILGWSLATLLLGVAQLAAQAVQPKQVTEDLVEVEGRRYLRDQYLEQRRQSVDPNLDKAQALVDAVSANRAAQAARGMVTIPDWAAFGPAPIANGQTPTSTPRFPSDVSGRVNAIAIDPVNEVVYMGGAQGGIWSSSDNGASWTPLSDDLASTAVGAIALDVPASPGSPITIYLGTGEGNGSCDSYAGVGLYKSTDSGATWTGPIGGAMFGNRSITGVAVDRNDSTRVLLTTSSGAFSVACIVGPTLPDRGVFLSTDSGATWTKQTTGNHRTSMIMQDPQTATTWWAPGATSSGSIDPANEGGLRKSTDNGVTWTQVAGLGGLPALATTWSRAWITGTADSSFPGQSVLYVANGQNAGPGSGRIFKSTDSGTNWTELTAARAYCSGQCSYDMPIWTEPGNSNILYTGGAGTSSAGVVPSQFMRSTNGGTSFTDCVRSADNSTAMHADVHVIYTWPGQPNRLWTGNDGGIWRSDDRCTNWVNVNSNLQLTQFTGGDLHPFNQHVVYAGSQDNGTEGRPNDSANPTNIWKHLDFGDGGFARIDQGNPNNLVHTYFNASGSLVGVGYTTAGFATTQGFYLTSFAPTNGITVNDRVLFYAPIHLDRGAPSTLYYGTHRLWRATNFFANPNGFLVLNGGNSLAGTTGSLSAIETFANPTPGANADIIYTGASTGEVFRSTDGGASFTQVDVGGSTLYVSDVIVNPANSNEVWQSRAGFAGAAGMNVRRSTDGGATWAAAANGIPDIPVNALVYDPVVSNRVWAGADIGVYFTEDGGATWTPHTSGLPNTAVFDLLANTHTRSLVALTHGRGAYKIFQGIFFDGFETGNANQWTTTLP
ncbi:MAG: hypothetical protein HC897_16840 [Thermoanaerobaculia bacterium]|nr:hypothetical protein [Thermoanaerobaculia bacterium]